jgi:hypothetical protein
MACVLLVSLIRFSISSRILCTLSRGKAEAYYLVSYIGKYGGKIAYQVLWLKKNLTEIYDRERSLR